MFTRFFKSFFYFTTFKHQSDEEQTGTIVDDARLGGEGIPSLLLLPTLISQDDSNDQPQDNDGNEVCDTETIKISPETKYNNNNNNPAGESSKAKQVCYDVNAPSSSETTHTGHTKGVICGKFTAKEDLALLLYAWREISKSGTDVFDDQLWEKAVRKNIIGRKSTRKALRQRAIKLYKQCLQVDEDDFAAIHRQFVCRSKTFQIWHQYPYRQNTAYIIKKYESVWEVV